MRKINKLLEGILNSPNLNFEEIFLLMNLDSTQTIYANVRESDIKPYEEALKKFGYYVGLVKNLSRTELNGRYVLEVR
jgi:hypothetical protein